jgi:hypothetical protein
MKAKKEYVWIVSGGYLIMRCVVHHKTDQGFIFLRTINGADMAEPRALGLDAFKTKREAIEYALSQNRGKLSRIEADKYTFQEQRKYLEYMMAEKE